MIRNIYTNLLFVILCAMAYSTAAQTRFSVPDTIANISKTTAFSTLHDHLQITNHTADSLEMRWQYRPISLPPQWIISFQDPNTWYFPLQQDSGDFYLPDSSDHFNNKVIIGIDHKSFAGYALLAFSVYEKSNPADSIRLYFEVLVRQAMSLEQIKSKPTFYPNPANDILYIENCMDCGVEIFNMQAERIFSGRITTSLKTTFLSEGIYLISIERKGSQTKSLLSIK